MFLPGVKLCRVEARSHIPAFLKNIKAHINVSQGRGRYFKLSIKMIKKAQKGIVITLERDIGALGSIASFGKQGHGRGRGEGARLHAPHPNLLPQQRQKEVDQFTLAIITRRGVNRIETRGFAFSVSLNFLPGFPVNRVMLAGC